MEEQKETPNYYVDENLKAEKEELSPSGRTKLVMRFYSTKKGCWDYSRGTLYRVSDGAEIADIKRNYSTFHHSWVEKDGQEYLISGRSYMNQCIVNCDEGKEIEVSDEKLVKMGVAFCWADANLSPDGNTLVVAGCHWAAPYQYKFFDFTNPMQGWPELQVVDRSNVGKEDPDTLHFYTDKEDPQFNEDGTITVFNTTEIYIPTGQREEEVDVDDEEYDNPNNWERQINVRHILRREGNVIVREKQLREDHEQKKALDELTQTSQDMGLYEE